MSANGAGRRERGKRAELDPPQYLLLLPLQTVPRTRLLPNRVIQDTESVERVDVYLFDRRLTTSLHQ